MNDNQKSDWRWSLLVAIAPTLVTEAVATFRWYVERATPAQPDRTGTIWERTDP